MPNLIKVGKTTKHTSRRMSELYSTGVPTPFELEFSAMVNNCDFSEKAAHKILSNYRVAGNREFFKISVKKALELILPVIGSYKIVDVKESHGIEQICRELAYRENQRREIELARRIARQREDERRSDERLSKRKSIQEKILFEEQKLGRLGSRPLKKELSSIENFLIFCYLPLPLGWIVWLSTINILNDKHLFFSWLCVGALIGGFFAYEKSKKIDVDFAKSIAPFREIDDVLYELHKQLATLP